MQLKDRKNVVLMGLPIALIFVSGAIVADYELRYKDTSFPGVFLNGQSYSGSSREEARKSLEAKIQVAYQNKMSLVYEDKTFAVGITDLGVSIDTAKTIDNIFSYGHQDDVIKSAKEQIGLLSGNANFQTEINEGAYLFQGSKWDEIAKLETPARDFSYQWNGKTFVPVKAEEGMIIDQEKLKKDILQNLLGLQNNPVQIALINEYPAVKTDADGHALTSAQNLIQKEIILKYDTRDWKVTKEDFGYWIGFEPKTGNANNDSLALTANKNRLKEYLATLSAGINREPVNAQLEFKNEKIGVFALSQDGIRLDVNASVEKIASAIFQNENYGNIASPQTDIAADTNDKNVSNDTANPIAVDLAITKVAPQLTTDSIDNMGITSLISTGESNFHGSTNSRRHNVAAGASKFNGVLIAPGEKFSFDKTLGEVGPKQGYLPELVIKTGKTVPEYGGGLCQVSTTAFRGAVAAGLEITQRTNHAYAVKYYAPQGTDATIYPPNPDLVFINNTPAYILIQTRISGDNLYFDFYGTNDGRKIVMEGPVIYERSAGGAMKTWWKQNVYDKNGTLFLTKTFYSNYKSAALYPTKVNPLE